MRLMGLVLGIHKLWSRTTKSTSKESKWPKQAQVLNTFPGHDV